MRGKVDLEPLVPDLPLPAVYQWHLGTQRGDLEPLKKDRKLELAETLLHSFRFSRWQ